MLKEQIAWYIAGPTLGVCVVACRILFNARLGITGGYSELVGKLGRGSFSFDWRGWFALGVAMSGALYLLLNGAARFEGYGWMTRTFEGTGQLWIVPLLVGSGVLIGYGAKLAGGCTSGNGLSGTSSLSPASLAATCTFFGTAIGVATLLEVII
ncbi:YeeE/YedE family protein [Paraconexibacter sp.]|uniref:YeeE/YedE family protein n=1 Tax=Paraconexibacter sp. TaxID=2949640 RepID=UPI0035692875